MSTSKGRAEMKRPSSVRRFILSSISSSLSSVDDALAERCADLILSGKKVFVYGVGRSGLIGRAFAMRLVQLGLHAFFIGETITPIVTEEDICILVSNTGTTMSAVQTANIVRRVGADVIVLTGNPTSKLAHAGTIVIPIITSSSARQKVCAPLGTLFEDAVLVFLDSMIPFLMAKLNETEASMRRRHAIWV